MRMYLERVHSLNLKVQTGIHDTEQVIYTLTHYLDCDLKRPGPDFGWLRMGDQVTKWVLLANASNHRCSDTELATPDAYHRSTRWWTSLKSSARVL
jgi:hypothetical protein